MDATGFLPRNNRLFPLGRIYMTRGAVEAFRRRDVPSIENLITRHATGDWGDMDEQDKAMNDAAVKSGGRIFSAYRLTDNLRVWIITEWDRSATTVLLPNEY